MVLLRIHKGEPEYPVALQKRLGDDAPPCLYANGEWSIISGHLMGLVCSIQCPGNVIIRTLDAARALRDAGVRVVGGFHSPLESECLDILLRGKQPVVLCPARTLKGTRLTPRSRTALNVGRLLLLTIFPEKARRTTAACAMQRNNLVAALADALWVPHATPGGKTWETVHSALNRKQPIFTFEVAENADLLNLGAMPYSLQRIKEDLLSS